MSNHLLRSGERDLGRLSGMGKPVIFDDTIPEAVASEIGTVNNGS